MENQLQAKIQERMAMQRQNIDAQRQQLAVAQNKPKEMDLSALMNLTDAWTGSNFSKGYQKPKDNSYQHAMMEQGLQKNEMGLMDDEIKLLGLMEKQKSQPKQLDLTPLEEKRDKNFGATWQDYSDSGGYANVAGNLESLRKVSAQLGIEGNDLVNTIQPKMLRDITNPESAAAQEDVESVVQQSLKQILGGQFSEKEAKQLIERAYNPRLSAAINKRKVDALIKKIDAMAQAKQKSIDWAAQHGTLKGFKGQTSFSHSDFDNFDSEKSNSGRSRLDELRAKMKGK